MAALLPPGRGKRGQLAPKPRRGRKLTPQQVGEIRRAYRSGERQADLARRFAVSPTTISQAIAGRRGWFMDVPDEDP